MVVGVLQIAKLALLSKSWFLFLFMYCVFSFIFIYVLWSCCIWESKKKIDNRSLYQQGLDWIFLWVTFHPSLL